jgi:hypothetical protein
MTKFSILDRNRKYNNNNGGSNRTSNFQRFNSSSSQQQQQHHYPSDYSESFSLITESLYQMQNGLQNNQQIPKTVFTVNCGELRAKDDGVRIKISGKVVRRPRSGRFLEIKDLKGCTQLVATDDKPEMFVRFQSVPADAYVSVIGTVQLRPVNFINNVSYS